MEGAIINWLLAHWPFLTFVVVLILFVVWVTCKVMNFYHIRFTPMEKMVKKIDKNIDRIQAYLISENPEAYQSLMKSKSPKTLTEIGRSLLIEGGGQHFVDDQLDTLIEEINKLLPQSPLDVETGAIGVLLRCSDSNEFIPIKNFLFSHPEYKGNKIQLYSMINVMSIYLRDKYFEKYPQSQESAST